VQLPAKTVRVELVNCIFSRKRTNHPNGWVTAPFLRVVHDHPFGCGASPVPAVVCSGKVDKAALGTPEIFGGGREPGILS
jgi:hypothetical protein